MTSLAFMFEDVPEPVWKTSIGNWSSCSPAAIASPAVAMRPASSASSSPRSAFTRAAAALMRPSQRTTPTGIGRPETGKLSIALRVSAPHSSVMDPIVEAGGAGGAARFKGRGEEVQQIQAAAPAGARCTAPVWPASRVRSASAPRRAASGSLP